jgi:hypothetical protein
MTAFAATTARLTDTSRVSVRGGVMAKRTLPAV